MLLQVNLQYWQTVILDAPKLFKRTYHITGFRAVTEYALTNMEYLLIHKHLLLKCKTLIMITKWS